MFSMFNLSTEVLNQLVNRRNIDKAAVDKFLSSIISLSKDEALIKLKKDAREWQWNAATVNCIRDGINLGFVSLYG